MIERGGFHFILAVAIAVDPLSWSQWRGRERWMAELTPLDLWSAMATSNHRSRGKWGAIKSKQVRAFSCFFCHLNWASPPSRNANHKLDWREGAWFSRANTKHKRKDGLIATAREGWSNSVRTKTIRIKVSSDWSINHLSFQAQYLSWNLLADTITRQSLQKHPICQHKNNSQAIQACIFLLLFVARGIEKKCNASRVVGDFRCWKRGWASDLACWWMIWRWKRLWATATYDNQPFWFY